MSVWDKVVYEWKTNPAKEWWTLQDEKNWQQVCQVITSKSPQEVKQCIRVDHIKVWEIYQSWLECCHPKSPQLPFVIKVVQHCKPHAVMGKEVLTQLGY